MSRGRRGDGPTSRGRWPQVSTTLTVSQPDPSDHNHPHPNAIQETMPWTSRRLQSSKACQLAKTPTSASPWLGLVCSDSTSLVFPRVSCLPQTFSCSNAASLILRALPFRNPHACSTDRDYRRGPTKRPSVLSTLSQAQRKKKADAPAKCWPKRNQGCDPLLASQRLSFLWLCLLQGPALKLQTGSDFSFFFFLLCYYSYSPCYYDGARW
ncbi:hypothetical protein VTO42DRAFT_866 [Malbranchea cinnamomea]